MWLASSVVSNASQMNALPRRYDGEWLASAHRGQRPPRRLRRHWPPDRRCFFSSLSADKPIFSSLNENATVGPTVWGFNRRLKDGHQACSRRPRRYVQEGYRRDGLLNANTKCPYCGLRKPDFHCWRADEKDLDWIQPQAFECLWRQMRFVKKICLDTTW